MKKILSIICILLSTYEFCTLKIDYSIYFLLWSFYFRYLPNEDLILKLKK